MAEMDIGFDKQGLYCMTPCTVFLKDPRPLCLPDILIDSRSCGFQ